MAGKANEKDCWDKAQVIANVIAAIAVPVIIAVVGFNLQKANISIAEREARVQEAQLFVTLVESLRSEDEIRSLGAEGAFKHLYGSDAFEHQWDRQQLRELLKAFIHMTFAKSRDRLTRAIEDAREREKTPSPTASLKVP